MQKRRRTSGSNGPARNLDVDRAAGSRLWMLLGVRRIYLFAVLDNHWQQRARYCLILSQLALAKQAPPREHLVRVHSFGLRHTRYAHPRLRSQINDPSLLRRRPPHTNPTARHEPIIFTRPQTSPLGNTGRLRYVYRAGTWTARMVPPSPYWISWSGCPRLSVPNFVPSVGLDSLVCAPTVSAQVQ